MAGLWAPTRKAYIYVSVTAFSTVVVALILNSIAGLVLRARDAEPPVQSSGPLFTPDGAPVPVQGVHPYYAAWFDFAACRELGEEYASEVVRDFSELITRGFIYQPWVGFAEPAFRSRRVNIHADEFGFPMRNTPDASNERADEEVAIFVMGGSTTFGYSVSDDHTWPSQLSVILNERARRDGLNLAVRVHNYGHAYFQPSQEAVLLIDLLKSGHRPSLVIFMDGVNWGERHDWPHFTEAAATSFHELQFPGSLDRQIVATRLERTALMRLAAAIWRRNESGGGTESADAPPPPAATGSATDAAASEMFFERFEQSRRISEAVCQLYDCNTRFFLQPNPRYRYALDLYRNEPPASFMGSLPLAETFYDAMRERGGYEDLSGLFEEWGRERKAIVDDVHYSPAFNRFIAERVAEGIDLEGLRRSRSDDIAVKTGEPRPPADPTDPN